MPKSAAVAFAVLLALAPMRRAAAAESIEFVAEHLPEVAMDNRLATLPVWIAGTTPAQSWQFTVQGGATRISSGGLALDGPMVSAAVHRRINDRLAMGAFAFLDDLQFSGASDQRPLETSFTQAPLALPAESLFTDLHGNYRNLGAGFVFNLQEVQGWLGERQWVAGALYQNVQLRDYRATYQVIAGPSTGAAGFVDYSGDYAHITPFAGLAMPRHFGSWDLVPHALIAVPVPRRGVQGRITGPGFDLSGDTDTAGNGKHFGDPWLSLGLDVTYRAWGLTLDLGSFVSQALLEPVLHKGVEHNWVISAYARF